MSAKSSKDCSRTESTLGKERFEGPSGYGETYAHNVSGGPEEDRGCSAGEVGEGEGWEEVTMRLEIDIPDAQQAMLQACAVPLAPKGTGWKESCLGKRAKETGVYVIHHAGTIKYVGKTDSPNMSYAMRLRREFQETASGGKHIYPKLKCLSIPPDIMVSFFAATEIAQFVRVEGVKLSNWQMIAVFEVALIHMYQPEFQRHHIAQSITALKKLGIPEVQASVLLKEIS